MNHKVYRKQRNKETTFTLHKVEVEKIEVGLQRKGIKTPLKMIR